MPASGFDLSMPCHCSQLQITCRVHVSGTLKCVRKNFIAIKIGVLYLHCKLSWENVQCTECSSMIQVSMTSKVVEAISLHIHVLHIKQGFRENSSGAGEYMGVNVGHAKHQCVGHDMNMKMHGNNKHLTLSGRLIFKVDFHLLEKVNLSCSKTEI